MTNLADAARPGRRDGEGRPDLSAWRETSWVRPLVVFAITFGLWMTTLALGLWSAHWGVRVALVLPLTLFSAQLFTLAHDAGHGSYSVSPLANAVVGRLALVPSVHVFGLWRAHHDIHHRFTNLRGRDFVWTPLSVDEYRALPPWRRALHRAYRHRSGLGLGLHYSIEIWVPRMLWPRSRHGVPLRRGLVIDAVVLSGALAILAVSAWGLVSAVDPARAGAPGFWVSTLLLLFVLPLVGTHWLIGFVICLNHTHPDVVWYDDPGEWSRHDVQLEGSTGVRFSPVRHAALPARIMNHTAHHVDPAVPLRSLAPAQEHLVGRFGDRVVSYDWSSRGFRDVLSRCKLYDYDARRWLTYAALEERA